MKSYPKTVTKLGRVRVCLELLRAQKLKGKTIIDIGSTFGWLAKEIKKDSPKNYFGIEPNNEAVLFSKANVPYAKFYNGYANHLPIKSNSCDIAVFFDVIEHVPVNTEIDCLKEINRTLKKGGVLLLSTPYDHLITKALDPAWYFGHRHYSKEKLNTLLKKTGFTIESFEVRGTYLSLIYMIAFYIAKWLLRISLDGTSLQKMDDNSYSNQGISTVYLKAVKK